MNELRKSLDAALEAYALHKDGDKLARAVRESLVSYPEKPEPAPAVKK